MYVQFWAPDDGRKTRLKHVEHLTDINKLWNVASCWLYCANSHAYYFQDQFHVILPSTFRSPWWSQPFRHTKLNFVRISLNTHVSAHIFYFNRITLIFKWILCSDAGVKGCPLNYTYPNSEVLGGIQLCHFDWILKYFNVIDVDRDVVCCLDALQCDPHLTGRCEVVFQDERHQLDPAHSSKTCLWKWQQPRSNSALDPYPANVEHTVSS